MRERLKVEPLFEELQSLKAAERKGIERLNSLDSASGKDRERMQVCIDKINTASAYIEKIREKIEKIDGREALREAERQQIRAEAEARLEKIEDLESKYREMVEAEARAEAKTMQKIEDLEKELEKIEQQKAAAERQTVSMPKSAGKGTGLNDKEVTYILTQFLKGKDTKTIHKALSHIKDRRQIERVCECRYRGHAARQQMRRCLNQLSQKNQSPQFLSKINKFKEIHGLN